MDMSVGPVEEHPNEIKPKVHFTGKVVKTSLAGAIIDLGNGARGVLHISQMTSPAADQPVKRVEEVVQVGQPVEVWVRKVKDDRIELTMAKPLDLEWREMKKGMNVKGKVTRLATYGAFVDIGAEREGLIHISELAHGYVRTPSEVVNEGDEVEAQVLDVNRRKKQIKLSLKALQEEPPKEEPVKLIEAAQVQKEKRSPGGGGRRKGGRGDRGADRQESAEVMAELNSAAEAEPTAMEVALREAMEKAKARKQAAKSKRAKSISKEQQDLLSRTLEQKVRT
ncbi:MAG: S1 RNA-binding domain-containing protein [Anaerolineaceae bacterium]|nr:S1 RNA-binding domain-containing protein [Anaerolineaceae bacterium]